MRHPERSRFSGGAKDLSRGGTALAHFSNLYSFAILVLPYFQNRGDRMKLIRFGNPGQEKPASAMNHWKRAFSAQRRRVRAALVAGGLAVLVWCFYAYGQDKSGYPNGYDAVQAAPASHKVVFENAFVRVLEVTVPPPGMTEPMHHHRWPGFFLSWDTGGSSPHVRYHRPDGSVKDQPSVETPVHPGRWDVQWMNPEPMHAIEVVADPGASPPPVKDSPPLLRVEIKCHP